MYDRVPAVTPLANALVACLAAYAAVGVVFAVPFVLRGVDRIDPAAPGSTWGFRLVIAPGVVALWPLLAQALAEGRTATVTAALRARHRRVVTLLAVVVPPLFLAGLALRRPPPDAGPDRAADQAAIRVEPAGGLLVEARWDGAESADWLRAAVVASTQSVSGLAARVDAGVGDLPPDLLVLWSPAGAASGSLDGALLLGPLAPGERRAFELPAAARDGGRLVVHSLARRETVAQAALDPLDPARGAAP